MCHQLPVVGEGGILHKAESTWCLLHPVQSHDDSLYLPTHREQLVYLFFTGVEGKVSHVERGTAL